jgi:tetratricopeptide (TPR) repeat protein
MRTLWIAATLVCQVLAVSLGAPVALATEEATASVVVIPPRNISGNDGADGYGDALALELARRLTTVGHYVVPVNELVTAYQYLEIQPETITDKRKALKVARAVGGTTVLYGNVETTGGDVRIELHAHTVSDGRELFVLARTGVADDPFALLDRIALDASLKFVTTSRGTRPAPPTTPSPKALKVLGRALQAWRLGKTALAISQADKLITASPTYGMGYWVKAWVMLYDSLDGRCMEFFEEAWKRNKTGFEENIGLAMGYGFVVADYPKAFQAFDTALSVVPDCPLCWSGYASLKMKTGELQQASDCLDKAEAMAPDDSDVVANRAALLITMGRAEESEPYCRRCIELDPTNCMCWLSKGLLAMKRDEFDESIRCFQRTIKTLKRFSPYMSGTLFIVEDGLGAMYAMKAAQDKDMERLSSFKKNLSHALVHIGRSRDQHLPLQAKDSFDLILMQTANELPLLLGILDEIADGEDASPSLEAFKGLVLYRSLQQRREGMDILEGVLHRHPDCRAAMNYLVALWGMEAQNGVAGRLTGALSLSEKLLRLEPANPTVITNHIGILNLANRRDEALALATRGVELFSGDCLIRTNYGMLLSASGDRVAAKTQYQTAIERDNNCGMAYANMAALLMKDAASLDEQAVRGAYVHIRGLLEKAMSLVPDEPTVWLNYGGCLLVLGEEQKAKQQLQRFLEVAPNHPSAPQIRNLLLQIP